MLAFEYNFLHQNIDRSISNEAFHFIFNSLYMVAPQIIRCVLQGAMLKTYPTIYKIN